MNVLRRAALLLSGGTFAVIAVIGLFAPHAVAKAYGLALVGVEGLAEFRAVFLGFWLSLTVLMVTAARRDDVPLLGDLCGLMLLLQASARILSLVVDGVPNLTFLGAAAGELGSALAILAPRVLGRRSEV